MLACKFKEISYIDFIFTLKTRITFLKGGKIKNINCNNKNNNNNETVEPRLVLHLQQRIPSSAAITTVDVLRRVIKNPSTVCLESASSIATLISCVPNGSSVNVMLDTNCWLTGKTVQVGGTAFAYLTKITLCLSLKITL